MQGVEFVDHIIFGAPEETFLQPGKVISSVPFCVPGLVAGVCPSVCIVAMSCTILLACSCALGADLLVLILVFLTRTGQRGPEPAWPQVLWAAWFQEASGSCGRQGQGGEEGSVTGSVRGNSRSQIRMVDLQRCSSSLFTREIENDTVKLRYTQRSFERAEGTQLARATRRGKLNSARDFGH